MDSWKRVDNGGAVAKLFRRMLACGGKMDSGLVREMIIGNVNTLFNNLTSSRHSAKYSLVFRKDSRYHYIRDEVLEYLG